MSLTETLFETIDKITEAKLNNNDTIKIYSVVNIKDENKGQYTLTDGFNEILAYSDNPQSKYKVGDLVRVSIIKGNFQYTNYIIGRYENTKNNEKDFKYYYIDTINGSGPVNNFISIEDNIQLNVTADNTIQVKFEVKYEGNTEYGIEITFYDKNKEATIHSVKFINTDMCGGDSYNFKVFTPQNFIYEIPGQFLLPELSPIYITVQPFGPETVEWKNVKIYIGQKGNKYVSLLPATYQNGFELKWTNTNPVIKENIGFSDGLGVIDEEEYQKHYFYETKYQNFKEMYKDTESFRIDRNSFDIYNRLIETEKIINKIIIGYGDIFVALNNLVNDLGVNGFGNISDGLMSKLTKGFPLDDNTSWPTNNDNHFIKTYYKNMFDYYEKKLALTSNNYPEAGVYYYEEDGTTTSIYYDQIIAETCGDANRYLRQHGGISFTELYLKVYEDSILPLVFKMETLVAEYYQQVGYIYAETINDEPKVIYASLLYKKLRKYWDIEGYDSELDPDYRQKIDLSTYDNKYCVYWYKKNDNNYDTQAGQGWEYIQGSTNKGIPTKVTDGNIYLPREPSGEDKIYVLPEKTIDKIKVILYANHIPYFAEYRIF